MRQARFPAVFYRGGTSKAIFFHLRDLPDDRALWDRIFLAALGSPDPHGRQLDGLGGGYSSVSKIAVIGPGSRPDVDVDYTFAQVDVASAKVDYKGNCGNISSAVGPFAVEEGLVEGTRVVRFLNTNTQKVIRATLDGERFELPGVPGLGERIALEFLDPGGAVTGKLLPTGRARDRLDGVEASLVDATNPMVFVRAADLGLRGDEESSALDARPGLLERLERLRALGAEAMGMGPSPAVPKVALIAPGEDVAVRVVSMGKFHKAVALTAAMCLAVAAHVPGTLVREAAGEIAAGQDVRIVHPAGVLPIAAEVRDGRAERVVVYRTARRLMEGAVLVPERVLSDPEPFADRLASRPAVLAE
jgi:2-methylaconitate cis-trans-isomerase PrpF